MTMHDFTPDALYQLLSSLKTAGYTITSVADYLRNPSPVTVILRHDIDARKANALQCARMEKSIGTCGTYYFRMTSSSYDEAIISEISNLGHEIGYHYEDLAATHGDVNKAIGVFEQNLAKLRRLVPIETICMHGSPLSKYDNRLLWGKYNYREYGLIGEPYLDIDFKEVMYLTDTGRRWNGNKYNIRDRVNSGRTSNSVSDQQTGGRNLTFHSTFNIIDAVTAGILPPKIMITIHPQRWENKPIPWIMELFWQNIKNIGKGIVNGSAS
jgi:hypothetical protein